MRGRRGARAVTPGPPLSRQPSGYSSASFYNYTSLSSSEVMTTDSDYEGLSSSASTSSSEETSPPGPAHAGTSPERTPRPRGSPVEQALSLRSGPSPEDCGGAGSPAHCSGAEERGSDEDHSYHSWASGPTESPRSGLSRPRQSPAHQGSPRGSDTDLVVPLRRVLFSPRMITLKHWRGECTCWHEKGGTAKARPACT